MREPRIDYAGALDQTLTDLEALIQVRNRADAEITRLRESVRVLSTMVKEDEEWTQRWSAILGWVCLNTPNLTNSVRAALSGAGRRGLTAIETRQKLEEGGFDFSGFTNPFGIAAHNAEAPDRA